MEPEQLDLLSDDTPPAKPKQPKTIYIRHEAMAKLLKVVEIIGTNKVKKDRITERMRKAVEAEIDRMYLLLDSISR